MSDLPLISIIGPTAVGKTAFAWEVARWLLTHHPEFSGVDFFSADSRQIYQGLEVISGADLPANGHFFTADEHTGAPVLSRYWQSDDQTIRWFGISSLRPDQEWSVAHWQRLLNLVLPQTHEARRIAVVVGGTGLYVTQTFNRDHRLHIPPNPAIREKAEALTLQELQEWLQQVNPHRFETLNVSDKANPRRLVRALEITVATTDHFSHEKTPDAVDFSREKKLILGLNDDFEQIEYRIKERVLLRWNTGAISEVETLLTTYPQTKLPVFSATGVRPIAAYITGQLEEKAAQEEWFRQERQYAKRQLTWWRKQPTIHWFEVGNDNWQTEALSILADHLK